MNKQIQLTLDAYNNSLIFGDFLPVYFGIEVTRHCNYACIMCPHSQIPNQNKGHMGKELFKRIIDDISQYAEIIKLHWIGEPLLHPEIDKLIEYARRNTLAKLHLSTNASLLYGKTAENIRCSGLDKIIISLDGMSGDSYDKIRKNGCFQNVLRNVESFIDSVDKNGGPLCHIKMIQFHQNQHETDMFKKKWSAYNNVMVDVMWLSDWAGNVPNINQFTHYHNPISQRTRTPCSDLWFKMQIDWLGKVAMCCFDAKGSVEIGDVSNNAIREIWQNPIIQTIRREHISKSMSGICTKCTDWAVPTEYEFWYTNDELIENPERIWHRD
jgi:sulfatase maturation enzyme AslB (radical SAM superfamily)